MKSLRWLWKCILAEAGMRCDTDTQRDTKTMSRRIKHEGVSFLTISLPAFCSDFERCLDVGLVDSTDFQGYRKSAGLPAFLQGFLSQVFDPVSGRLLEDPSTEAILCIRQICLMWKKVNLPCSLTRTRRSIDAYLQVEDELRGLCVAITDESISESFRDASRLVWENGLGRIQGIVSSLSHKPKHGPGAIQERGLRGNRKYRAWLPYLQDESCEREGDGSKRYRSDALPANVHAAWHTRLEPYFPFDAFGVPNVDALRLEKGIPTIETEFRDPGAESPVRVITVPKTQKTPRIIAIEPLCMQYAQQALMETMVDTIESSSISAGHVNFRDQSINQRLAQEASRTGFMATIDLSEASDRVSLSLVRELLGCNPDVLGAVLACRSTRAELPDGRVIALQKFASMGSALCFPVESMVFFTIALIAGLHAANLPTTARNLKKVAKQIYVYGDDLILPVRQVESTIKYLEYFNLKVNARKSFWTGKFRESCGVDAYDGVNVTPVYVRNLPPRSRRKVPEILSLVSLANQLYFSGWWSTAGQVRRKCETFLGPLPHVLDSSPCLGWRSVTNAYSIRRWNVELHCFEIKAWCVTNPMYVDPLPGEGALMKFFLKRGLEPSYDKKHLERSVRPDSARITYRWASPC